MQKLSKPIECSTCTPLAQEIGALPAIINPAYPSEGKNLSASTISHTTNTSLSTAGDKIKPGPECGCSPRLSHSACGQTRYHWREAPLRPNKRARPESTRLRGMIHAVGVSRAIPKQKCVFPLQRLGLVVASSHITVTRCASRRKVAGLIRAADHRLFTRGSEIGAIDKRRCALGTFFETTLYSIAMKSGNSLAWVGIKFAP